MLAKHVTVALATTLLATAAFAQTPTTTDQTPPAAATSDSAKSASGPLSESSLQGDWRASKVVGLSVYNASNEKLGSINDLLMDKSGNIKAVVLGVGGFLGVGEHLVAVPLDKVKFVNEPIAYTGTVGAGSTTTTPKNTTTTPSATTGSANSSTATKTNPWYPDHAVFDATKDQLQAMPEFKYST